MGSGFRRKGFKGKESINFAGVDRSGRGFNPRPAQFGPAQFNPSLGRRDE